MENTKTTDNSKLNYFLFFFSRSIQSAFMTCVVHAGSACAVFVSALLYFSGIRRSSWIVALSSRFYGAFAFISQYVEPFQRPDETPRSV